MQKSIYQISIFIDEKKKEQERELPQSDKGHVWKTYLTSYMMTYGLNSFPLRLEAGQDCLLLPCILLDFVAILVRREKVKRHKL